MGDEKTGTLPLKEQMLNTVLTASKDTVSCQTVALDCRTSISLTD
jgi:hypothetical protein